MIPEKLPSDRSARWKLLNEILNHWFPPVSLRAGFERARLNSSWPAAFREWLERFGARTDVWCLQDNFLPPEEMKIHDGVLVFAREAQDAVEWGIRESDFQLEDPPVMLTHQPTGNWIKVIESFSAFAIYFALINVKWSPIVSLADGQISDEEIAQIEKHHRRLPFPDMNWPPFPTRLYAGDDSLIEIDGATWSWTSRLT